MEIELTKGKVALIDKADYARVSQHSWCASNNGRNKFYCQSTIEQKRVFLHRFILEAPKGTTVDHINGDTLDNRRRNLRVCTKAQNTQNQKGHSDRVYSTFKGVTFDKNRGKWLAQLQVNKKRVYIGRFSSEEDAAYAYKDTAKKFHGEFSCV